MKYVYNTPENTCRTLYSGYHLQDIPFQTCALGLLRSDYMVDYDGSSVAPDREPRLRQIEINTISSSFFALTQDKVRNLQM